MTEQEWLTSNDPGALMNEGEWLSCHDARRMLDHHQWIDGPHPFTSERKCRLFAEEVERLWYQRKGYEWNGQFSFTPPEDAYGLAVEIARTHDLPPDRPWIAAVVRDVFGNPYRPVTIREEVPSRWPNRVYIFEPRWLRWRDGLILSMARSIYERRSFDELGQLADALEEAGVPSIVEEEGPEILAGMDCPYCTNWPANGWVKCKRWKAEVADNRYGRCKCNRVWLPGYDTVAVITPQPHPILAHLRSPGPHVRGCHVVDLLLGKE